MLYEEISGGGSALEWICFSLCVENHSFRLFMLASGKQPPRKARQGKAIQVTTNTIYPMHAYIRTPLQMKYTFPCHKKYGMYCTALHCIGLRCVARKLPRWGREKIEQTNTTHFAGKFEARNTTKPWPRSAASWRRSFIHYFGSVRFSHPLCFSTSYCM
mmetsp:Transcript_18297/g.38141  ORF Transcript_18297/g.38141 Transcript_18297/m.38141 type:complete len:159 (+) Transcript_18297:886-1362(+)